MGRILAARNPRTGEQDYRFAVLEGVDLETEALRLRDNQRAWAEQGVDARCAALQAFKAALLAHFGPIAAAVEADTGRRKIAAMEVYGVAGGIDAWSAQAPHLTPSAWKDGVTNKAIRHRVQWVPYPLVGVISPWNFPLLLSFIDAVPALAAGCAVIIKPSEVTPRWIEPVRAALAQVPELAGVLAFAPGDGATGAAVIGEVDAVAFTGSVATGKKIAAACAAKMIPAFLELGGKDPLIITATADLDAAVNAALRGSVLSTGQACQSIERIYVQRPLYEPFVERLVAEAGRAELNWPDIASGEIGPLIFDRQAAVIESHIADAVAKGATVRCGGVIETHGGGRWVRPTVLTGVDHTMKVITEETFGPVMPIMAFDGIAEAITLANATEYGLSAAVIAGTLEEAEAIGRELEAGAVSLNDAALTALFYEAPHESFKLSGMGRSRMGAPGLQRFLREKALIAQTGAPAPLAAFSEAAA
jgi:succinate-semialdehyde dehydrogenase / glutarate-semialdehyde dehydrogenase